MTSPGWTFDEACNPDLHAQLRLLSEWLRSELAAPEWKAILVTERLVLNRYSQVRVSADAVWTPDTYAERFSRLMRAGYLEIRLETLGILDSNLVTSIIVPGPPLGAPRTVVILRGLPRWVCEIPGWSLEKYLLISRSA